LHGLKSNLNLNIFIDHKLAKKKPKYLKLKYSNQKKHSINQKFHTKPMNTNNNNKKRDFSYFLSENETGQIILYIRNGEKDKD
jgi:hypothetical protein